MGKGGLGDGVIGGGAFLEPRPGLAWMGGRNRAVSLVVCDSFLFLFF